MVDHPSSIRPHFVEPRDQAYIESQADAQLRDVMTSSVTRYRRTDQLNVGDSVPALILTRLDSLDALHLNEALGAQPLVLIFGSYT